MKHGETGRQCQREGCRKHLFHLCPGYEVLQLQEKSQTPEVLGNSWSTWHGSTCFLNALNCLWNLLEANFRCKWLNSKYLQALTITMVVLPEHISRGQTKSPTWDHWFCYGQNLHISPAPTGFNWPTRVGQFFSCRATYRFATLLSQARESYPRKGWRFDGSPSLHFEGIQSCSVAFVVSQ